MLYFAWQVNVGKRGVVALNGAALQLENCGSRATKGKYIGFLCIFATSASSRHKHE